MLFLNSLSLSILQLAFLMTVSLVEIKSFVIIQGPCAPNKKCAPEGELTLRTSVITYGSKGELALRGTFLFSAHGPKII